MKNELHWRKKKQRSQCKSLQTRKCLGLWFFTNGISLIMLCVMHLIWNVPLLQVFSCFNYLYHSWPEKPLKHFLAAWWPFQGTLSSRQHRSHDVYASGAVVSSIMVHTDTGDRNSEKRNVIPSVTSVGRSLLLVASIPIIPLSQPYAVSFYF